MSRYALAAVFLCAACAKHEANKAAEAPTKRERCQAIATQASQTAGMTVALLAAGLSDDNSGLSASEKADLDREMASAKSELVKECMAWDDEVLDCFRPFAALSDKCQRTLSLAMGGSVAPADVQEGPAPKWTYALPAAPTSLVVSQSGQVVSALDDGSVVAVGNGEQRWAQPVADAFHIELPPAGVAEPMVILTNSKLVTVDADGKTTLDTKLPVLEDPDAEEVDEEYADLYPPTFPGPATIVRRGDHWLIGDREARFIEFTPGPCDKGQCMVVEGALPDEYFDRGSVMALLPDGSLLLAEDTTLRLLDRKFVVRFEARAHDSLDGFAVAEDGSILALFDHDLVQLDPIRCQGSRAFAPSSYPQKNRLYFEDSDECPECVAPPAGCVRSRHYVQDSVADKPVLLNDGTVIVDTMDGTRGLLAGKQRFSLTLGATGVPMPFGDDAIVMGEDFEANGQVSLWRLAADGRVRSRSLLPNTANLDLYWSDDGRAATRGSWVAVAVKSKLYAFEL